MDQYTGGDSGLGRSVGDPFKNHHEHQVAKKTDHKEELRDQHKTNAAYLPKVPDKNTQTSRQNVKASYSL